MECQQGFVSVVQMFPKGILGPIHRSEDDVFLRCVINEYGDLAWSSENICLKVKFKLYAKDLQTFSAVVWMH